MTAARELSVVDKLFQDQCKETAYWFRQYLASQDERATERARLRRQIADLEEQLRQARALNVGRRAREAA